MVEAKNRESSHWWWFDSHSKGSSNRSPWLQSALAELDDKTKTMLRLIEEDADSFAKRAEMYYKKRPELISMVEDFYRTHRSLAERYDLIKSEPSARLLSSPFSSPQPFTKYRLEKSLSLSDRAYDSYSEAAYDAPDASDDSEVDDPEPFDEPDIDENHDVHESEEIMRLREEVEKLREENRVQKEEMMQKDEEKREVIRQLSLAMDLLREENVKLRKSAGKNSNATPKKESKADFKQLKENFFGKLFGGFGPSQPVVAL